MSHTNPPSSHTLTPLHLWKPVLLFPAVPNRTAVQMEAMGPMVGKVSESLTLTCHISGVPISDSNYAWDWIRQSPGGGLEWVSFIEWRSGTRKQYGAGVQGRATASRDNSRSESILSLRDLQPRDSARYFCAVRTGTGNPLWGKGLLGVGASGQFPGSEVPSLCTPGVPGLSFLHKWLQNGSFWRAAVLQDKHAPASALHSPSSCQGTLMYSAV
uniref:Ig-like domain-containing protein n=1 Tax=Aquila chrysaetos chrysaetos TaxID=223781 RepID=A0A663DMK3_AQUCH